MRNFYTGRETLMYIMAVGIAAPKPDIDTKANKKRSPGHHLLILINILKQKSINFIDFEPCFFNRKQARKILENQ